MFELGRFGEIIIILVAALILIGPQELPKVMRTLGRWSQKLQRFKDNLTQNLDHHFYEGKFEEYQKNINQTILEPAIVSHSEEEEDHIWDEIQSNLSKNCGQTEISKSHENNASKTSFSHDT